MEELTKEKNAKTYKGIRKIVNYCLENNILEITFLKKDGSERKIKCTLKNEILINDKKYIEFLEKQNIKNNQKDILLETKLETNDNPYVNVWDLEKSDWRKINIDNILEVNILKR